MVAYFDMTYLPRIISAVITFFSLAFIPGVAVDSSQQPFSLSKKSEIVISLKEILTQKDLNWLIVDVRRQKEFVQFHVRGSLNIPIHELKSKPFLKTRNVVLVNARNHHLLLDRVITLRQEGFTGIRVLRGGLKSWQHQGGSLDGDFFKSRFLDELPAREFQLFKDFGNWQIFVCSKNPETYSVLTDKVAQTHRINDVDMLRERIEQQPRDVGNIDNYILIVTDDGQEYEQIRHLLERIEGRDVYYLQGGIEGYTEYMDTQAALKNLPTKEQSQCGTCP